MACGQTGWTFHEGELDTDDVRSLLAMHFAEMRACSPPEACHVLPADSLSSGDIRFVSLRDDGGALLGVGALKSLEPDHGEIKSMRTAPNALGRGVGGAMLRRLLTLARDERMARVSLETGNSDLFRAANRLYLRDGFERCAPFGTYRETPFTHFYTKRL